MSMKKNLKNKKSRRNSVPFLMVISQIVASILFVGAAHLFNAPHHRLVSLYYGLIVVNVYVFIFHWAIMRLLKKKSVALATLAIVFKWSILWLIIRNFLNNPNKDYLYLSVGLGSIMISIIIYGALLQFFEERI